jgi:hypothetical protein
MVENSGKTWISNVFYLEDLAFLSKKAIIGTDKEITKKIKKKISDLLAKIIPKKINNNGKAK